MLKLWRVIVIPKTILWSRFYVLGGGKVNKAIRVISLLNKIDMKINNANVIKCLNSFIDMKFG